MVIVLNQAWHTKEKDPNFDKLNAGLKIHQKYPKCKAIIRHDALALCEPLPGVLGNKVTAAKNF